MSWHLHRHRGQQFMRNTLQFGDIKSEEYGVYISGPGVYDAPARVYKSVSVPGRNGELIISGDNYKNINVKYPAFIFKDFKNNVAAFRNALLCTNGYARLFDSYHPEEFRVAYYPGGFKVDARSQHDAGEFEIEFNCKPQRYLYSGEEWNEYADEDALYNPTLCDAKPCIVVEGYGTLTVGHNVIEINEHIYPYIVIDSEIMDCYAASDLPLDNSAVVGTDVLKSGNYLGNANMIVSFTAGDFPVFPAGSTGVEFDNTITGVWICPRWWQL